MMILKKKNRKLLTGIGLVAATFAIGFILSNKVKFASANEAAYQNVSSYNPTEVLISEIGETARQLGQENDLYASVMIAQAILESNSGQSGLAAAPHYNLFGVKGQYNGQAATMQTLEDDGQGNTYEIDADFRSYPSYTESLQDYVAVLSQGYYADAWKSNTASYQDATAALTGVYATDTGYADKLNNIIAKYNLTQYDQPNLSPDGLVYNDYRQQYTSQEILDLDIAWASR